MEFTFVRIDDSGLAEFEWSYEQATYHALPGGNMRVTYGRSARFDEDSLRLRISNLEAGGYDVAEERVALASLLAAKRKSIAGGEE